MKKWMGKIVTIAALFFVFFVMCESAKAENVTRTFQPLADFYVDSSNPNTNYSTSATLSMGYNTITQTKKRAFIFMNAYLPPTAVVRTASLSFWIDSCFGSEKISIGQVDPLTASFVTFTWNNQPTWGTVLHKTAVCNPGQRIEIDIKEIVDTWTAEHSEYGLALFGAESGVSWGKTIKSREGASIPNVTINFDYTPVLPVVSNLRVNNITKTSAVMEWTTDVENVAVVQANTSPALTDAWIVPGEFLATSHSVDLTGLNPGQKYYISVYHYESNTQNTYNISGWQEFTTATDSTPSSSNITDNSAISDPAVSGNPASSTTAAKSSVSDSDQSSSESSNSAGEDDLLSVVQSVLTEDNNDPERWPYTLNMFQRRLLVGGILLVVIAVPLTIIIVIRSIIKKKRLKVAQEVSKNVIYSGGGNGEAN